MPTHQNLQMNKCKKAKAINETNEKKVSQFRKDFIVRYAIVDVQVFCLVRFLFNFLFVFQRPLYIYRAVQSLMLLLHLLLISISVCFIDFIEKSF